MYIGHEHKNTQLTYAVPLSEVKARFLLLRHSTVEGDTRLLIVRGSKYRVTLENILFNQCQFIKDMKFISGKWWNQEPARLEHKDMEVMRSGALMYVFHGVEYSIIDTAEVVLPFFFPEGLAVLLADAAFTIYKNG